MLTVIGTTQQQRGLMTDAEASLDGALEVFPHLGKSNVDYVKALKARATLHYDRGELDDAMAGLRQADRVARAAGLSPPDELRAEATVQQASIQLEKGNTKDAVATLQQLLSAVRGSGATGHYIHAYALQTLGAALDADARPAAGIPYLQQSLEMAQTLQEQHPTLLCDVLNDLSIALFDADRVDESMDRTRQTIACARRYYGDYHQTTLAAMVNLAWMLSSTGHPDQAADQYARLLPAVRIVNGSGPSVDMAVDLGMMALARDEAGRDDALDAIRAALHEAKQLKAADTPNTDWIEPVYGLMLFERNMAGAGERMGDYPEICNQLETLPRSHQRLCIARLLVASDSGRCLLESDTDPTTDMSSEQQRPWLAGYWLVRQRCSNDASTRKHTSERLHGVLAKLPSPPVWLLRRLTTADH